MPRLITSGFETGHVNSENWSVVSAPPPAVVATNARTGNYSLECVLNANAAKFAGHFGIGGGANVDYFFRTYMKFSANPAFPIDFISYHDGVAYICYGRLETNGSVTLRDKNGAQIGSPSASLSTNTYYCFELFARPNSADANAGKAELRLDHRTVARSEAATIGVAGVHWPFCGPLVAPGGNPATTLHFDDAALNYGVGGVTVHDTWAGEGRIVFLKPISDNARAAGWLAGAGGTTDLWDALNNTPPVGVVLASATNTSQVKNAVATTTENLDLNLESYATAGVTADDTVKAIQPIVESGDNVTAQVSLRIGLVSNPTQTNVAGSSPGSPASGTWPSGWGTLRMAHIESPVVVIGTSPVLRLGKNTNNTNTLMACQTGVVVDYAPTDRITPIIIPRQAVQRAAVI